MNPLKNLVSGDRVFGSLLALITASALAMRLLAPLTTQGLPFFDSWGYYHNVLTMQQTNTDPLYSSAGYFGELPALNFILYLVSQYTGLSAFIVTKYLPPILISLVVIPSMYIIAARVTGRRDLGLVAALLFAISDVGALRESYALPEGIATTVALVLIVALIKLADTGKSKWWIAVTVLLLAVFSAHNLTPFVFLLVVAGAAAVMTKVSIPREGLWLAASLCIAGAFTALTGLHASVDRNAFVRYLQLVNLLYSHSQAITSGTGFGNPLSGYATGGGQTRLLFIELHLITVTTLLLSLVAFAKYIVKPSKDPMVAMTFMWLMLTGVLFVMGVAGDSLFGANNPFFGYRTWIYLMFPASIVAALSLRSLTSSRKSLKVAAMTLLTLVLIASASGAVVFMHRENLNFEEVDAHDVLASNWLETHLEPINVTVYSADGFIPTINGPASGVGGDQDKQLLLGNLTYLFKQGSAPYYVFLSQRTLEYPFQSTSYRIETVKFYNPLFDVVYSSGAQWIFQYSSPSASAGNYTYSQLNNSLSGQQ